ncbi:MAG TPA: AraC family transcriptional regulator [Acidobacteriaceae bacterium]|nr:AraC family transcriptional regulator [Acidobacteriaceae bacterium]
MATILPAGQHHGTFLTKWSSETQLVCRIKYQGGSTYEEHGNERASIVFIEKGMHTKRFGRSTLHLPRGSMLLIPPSYLQVDSFEWNTVILAAEIPAELMQQLRDYGVVLHDHVQISACDAAPLRNRLQQELRKPDELSGLVFEAIIAEFVVDAVRKTRREKRTATSRMQQARDLLHDRMSEPLRLRDVAAALEVHPSQLSRDFRRSFGTTPGEYLRRLRHQYATRQIEETSKPLAEIAANSGFADQAHLSRAFKRYNGFSPSRYRGTLR